MTAAKWGQNFLVNKNVAEKMVRHFLSLVPPFAEKEKSCILEVGPGQGILTDLLVKYRHDNPIKIVELDAVLFNKLVAQYQQFEGIEIINEDILDINLAGLFAGEKPVYLISNVPYYISGEFIDWIVVQFEYIKLGMLMMQKEFVDRLAAKPETKDYSAQSVVFNYLFRLEKLFEVSPGSFSPHPKVKSTVFTFESKWERIPVGRRVDVPGFYLFLRTCFENRRKTLLNNLERHHKSEKLWKLFEIYGINPKIRAE
ncbi:MAG: 16S rRNA (adenine(1518)-N(6)/adenine(1519)-N(6))-dimethyltransferase RsmA, partial [Acidobacteria bacterium]|nr:16S rRNA (adenine(1518)-N(6)/adenine(1519)-N(6))-dimethyltransferase RsmA [Acidobacteriota bacterium]